MGRKPQKQTALVVIIQKKINRTIINEKLFILTLMKYLILLRLPASLVTWWPKNFEWYNWTAPCERCFYVRLQRRLRSDCEFVQSGWSLRCVFVDFFETICAVCDRGGPWSGCARSQADLSPCWSHAALALFRLSRLIFTGNLKPALLYYSAVSCTGKLSHVANTHELHGMTFHFICLILSHSFTVIY